MNKVSTPKSLDLHPFDTHMLGIIRVMYQSEEWADDIFGEEPAILKNATRQQRWDFFERVLLLIDDFMLSEYPNRDWKGAAVLYDAFINPVLESVFGGNE